MPAMTPTVRIANASLLPGRPAPEAGFAAPYEMLGACHDKVQRMLDLLERLQAHLREHGPDGQAAQAARDVMRYFDLAAPLHHEDEERHVFPLLLHSEDPAWVALAGRLQQEHRDMVPAWARPPETTFRYLARDRFGDYADFVYAFVRHFRGKIKYVIVWNEPNLTLEWGQRPPDPEAYAELLALAYAHAKEADPEVQVLAAGLAPTLEPPGSALGLDDLVFLQRMLDAGAGSTMDGLALHAYGLTFPPDDPADPRQLNFARVELLHDLLVRAGLGDRPCYITEGGWNDHPRWTRAVRAYERMAYTVRAYDKVLREWPWCRAVCLWVFRYPWPQGSYQDYFAFVTPGFIPKPVYSEVRHYARGEPFEYIEERVP